MLYAFTSETVKRKVMSSWISGRSIPIFRVQRSPTLLTCHCFQYLVRRFCSSGVFYRNFGTECDMLQNLGETNTTHTLETSCETMAKFLSYLHQFLVS
jgi:hypothetical protein